MEDEIFICEKCSKEIPFGQKYYTIVKSLEHFVRKPPLNLSQIQVDEAIGILTLCEDCGECFSEENLGRIIKAIPIKGQESIN